MDKIDFSAYIPSNNMILADSCANSMKPIDSKIFNGTRYPSFSKLVNDCIVDCKNEIVIICNDKSRPKEADVKKLLELVEDGYGIVGLYRFGFFGFKKDLIRKIGFFDERFISGGYEDSDMLRRLAEANIAYYESEEIEYHNGPSRWSSSIALSHFNNKWDNSFGSVRKIPDEKYSYDIGPYQGSIFRSWEDTKILPMSMGWYSQMCDIIKGNK